jgi:hypothetical protein
MNRYHVYVLTIVIPPECAAVEPLHTHGSQSCLQNLQLMPLRFYLLQHSQRSVLPHPRFGLLLEPSCFAFRVKPFPMTVAVALVYRMLACCQYSPTRLSERSTQVRAVSFRHRQ